MMLLFALNMLTAALLGAGISFLFWAQSRQNLRGLTWIVWLGSIATLIGWVWGTGHASRLPSSSASIEGIALALQLLSFGSGLVAMRIQLNRKP